MTYEISELVRDGYEYFGQNYVQKENGSYEVHELWINEKTNDKKIVIVEENWMG